MINQIKNYLRLKYIKDIIKINMIFLLFFMISDSMDVYIPLYIKDNNLPAIAYGILQTITIIFRMLIIWWLAKPKIKTKKKIIMVIFILNIANFLLVTSDFKLLYFYVFITIIATRTLLNTIYNPYLARLLPNEYMGIGFGIRDVFLSTGCAIGLFISGKLSMLPESYFISFIIFCLILITLFIFFTPMKEIDELENRDEESLKDQNFWMKLSKKMQINFIIICVVGILISLGLTVQSYMTMIGEDIGITTQNIYNLFSTSVIITAVFSVIGGVIIDKYNQKLLYIIYILICLLSIGILLIKSPFVYLISIVLLGLKGVFDNVEQTYFFKAYRKYDMERLWSINSIIQMISSLIAPIIFGYLYDIDYNLMIGVGTLLIVIAIGFSFSILNIEKLEQSLHDESDCYYPTSEV